MAKWRPEGWKLKVPFALTDHATKKGETVTSTLLTEREKICYEAGASAMLWELRKKGIAITAHDYPSYWVNFEIPNHPLGKWVFIPEDEES